MEPWNLKLTRSPPAGRGIVHAEMPGKNEDGSPNVGLQLWVDLPKDLKYCEPRYRDLRGEEIPIAKGEDGKVEVKVISGNSLGVDSLKDLAYTPVWMLDVTMRPGSRLQQQLPKGWNAFAYVLEGENIIFGENAKVGQYYNVVFDQKGDGIDVVLPDNAEKKARFGRFSLGDLG
jgi:redox-sensitive bicupin YhaK (pirin superfamily)